MEIIDLVNEIKRLASLSGQSDLYSRILELEQQLSGILSDDQEARAKCSALKVLMDRSAHEIGNALVAISTHQQLLAQSHQDPNFRASLNSALADSVRRICQVTSQLRGQAIERPSGFPDDKYGAGARWDLNRFDYKRFSILYVDDEQTSLQTF